MTPSLPQPNSRLGMHYYPDTLHYREQDLQTWLPELQALGARWLTLIAPPQRAIPEYFLRGLLEAEIEPLLRIPLQPGSAAPTEELNLLLNNYARWGVHYVTLFDRPNVRRVWPAPAWAQADLVERFLDDFIPIAEIALSNDLTPVFPPLEPGGDYWDTAFLQSALQSLKRRSQARLSQNMALGAFAWTYDRPLDWGAGGPERWPSAQAYFTPADSQDQIGLRIFEWYQAIAQAELGHSLPILLVGCGSRLRSERPAQLNIQDAAELRRHAECNLSIAQLFNPQPLETPKQAKEIIHNSPSLFGEGEEQPDQALEQVLCANFWLLAAAPDSQEAASAWYRSDGSLLPVVNAFKQIHQKENTKRDPKAIEPGGSDRAMPANGHPIDHYLLLPLYIWGVADWDLEAIRPFVHQYHPAIGFSVYEARLASRVTILGEAASISNDTLTILRAAGCQIDRWSQDGTLLAI